jgi:hypothetical protein
VPTLYVNGEKYDFSEDVIDRGNELYRSFLELHKVLQKAYIQRYYQISDSDFDESNYELIQVLEEFDDRWTNYEDLYVHELMTIEGQARRFIAEAIELECKFSELEKNSKSEISFIQSTNSRFKESGEKLSNVISKINSIANYDGHGRDDLTYDILDAAEEVLLKVSVCESESLRKLAVNIKTSFENLRGLLRKYADNIEMVDPQLRNNPDLVELLVDYEKYWEKGKIYFLDKKRCEQLIFFTNVIEGLCEKYAEFKEKLECCDSEIFILIPMIMLLKKVDCEDQGICETYLPQITDASSSIFENFKTVKCELLRMNENFMQGKDKNTTLKRASTLFRERSENTPGDWNSRKYKTLLKSSKTTSSETCSSKMNFEFFKMIEKLVITNESVASDESDPVLAREKDSVEKVIKLLRTLSIELQRNNPTDWNSFLDVSIYSK